MPRQPGECLSNSPAGQCTPQVRQRRVGSSESLAPEPATALAPPAESLPESPPGALELIGKPELTGELVDAPARNKKTYGNPSSRNASWDLLRIQATTKAPPPPWPPRHVGYVDLNVVCFRFDFPSQVVFNLTEPVKLFLT